MFIQNQLTRVPIPIPIPNINPLQPPLGAAARRRSPTSTFLKDTAKLIPMQAIWRAASPTAKQSQDAVSGSGTLDVLRYGRVLKARGSWSACAAPASPTTACTTCKSVTSTLKRGEFKQSFTLTRNGLVSITPSGAGMSARASSTASTAAWCSTTSTRCRSAGCRCRCPTSPG